MSGSATARLCEGSRREVLAYLRAHGRSSIADLAGATGLAPVTLRHHLGLLREGGLVLVDREPAGRGRPRHVYRLSPQGVAELAEQRPYARLAADLIDALEAAEAGAAARALRAMGARLAAARREAFAGLPLEDRLEVLVSLLADEGFALRWSRDGDTYVIREAGCPYRALAQTHGEVCALDLEVIRRVVGAAVTYRLWRGEGDPPCVFRVPVDVADTGV
jgi:DeoR family transcriptional regulator, suf operon transcriptional repressor